MMHVVRHGAGPRAFVALHGWGGSHLTFAPLAPHLPPDVSLFAVDLPGYGRSPRADGSAEEVAGAVVRTVDAVGAADVTLVGNCSGAIFALLAALGAPRVRRVVLVDPFAFVPWYFKVFLHPAIGRYAYYSTFANPLGRWITNASLRRQRAAGSHLTQSFRRVDHEVSLRYLAILDAVGDVSFARGVGVPVDILFGERTFGAVKASLPRWREVLPQARLWPIGGAGHLPIEEAPAQVAALAFSGGPLRRTA